VAATVYVKDIVNDPGTLPYYESGATSCDDVTAADTNANMQAALNASGTNGILVICPGTYTQTELNAADGIVFTHNGQTVQGSTGVAGDVILDANDVFNQAVTIGIGKDNGTLRDLTLTGGKFRGVLVWGNDGTTIQNVISEYNVYSTPGTGAGFSLYGDTPAHAVTNATLTGNIARNNGKFGFINYRFVTDAIYRENLADSNSAGYGGAGFSGNPLSVTLDDPGYPWTQVGATNVWYQTMNVGPVGRVIWKDNAIEMTEEDGATTTVAEGNWDWDSNVLYINVGIDPITETIVAIYAGHGPINYYDNTSTNTFTYLGTEGHGFYCDDGASDVHFHRDLSYNNQGAGFSVNRGENVTLDSVISYGNNRGIDSGFAAEFTVRNATVVNNTANGIQSYIAGFTNVAYVNIYNTIISGNGGWGIQGATGSVMVEDYNLLQDNSSGDRQECATGAHSISGDPLFVNSAGGNFNLKTGSPAIDAGLDLGDAYTYDFNGYRNQDFYGSGWEIGALIYPSRKIHRRISGQGIY